MWYKKQLELPGAIRLLCKTSYFFILITAGAVPVISWSHLWYKAVVVSSWYKFLLELICTHSFGPVLPRGNAWSAPPPRCKGVVQSPVQEYGWQAEENSRCSSVTAVQAPAVNNVIFFWSNLACIYFKKKTMILCYWFAEGCLFTSARLGLLERTIACYGSPETL